MSYVLIFVMFFNGGEKSILEFHTYETLKRCEAAEKAAEQAMKDMSDKRFGYWCAPKPD